MPGWPPQHTHGVSHVCSCAPPPPPHTHSARGAQRTAPQHSGVSAVPVHPADSGGAGAHRPPSPASVFAAQEAVARTGSCHQHQARGAAAAECERGHCVHAGEGSAQAAAGAGAGSRSSSAKAGCGATPICCRLCATWPQTAQFPINSALLPALTLPGARQLPVQ